ncbi:MAG: cytidylate kinase-like family protein [Bacteroidales bacterium]|nr:cytidylate kinase-like family protein [Bacteroidales bacterium]
MDTGKKFVITISREVGSGGRTIGRALAEKLGVRYADKDVINALVEKYGYTPASIERIKGEKKNIFNDLFSHMNPVPHPAGIGAVGNLYNYAVTNDDIFHTESEVLKKIASEGSCVVAGRSGFFILKDLPNKIDVFIHASMQNRVRRVMEKQGISAKEAEEIIHRIDKSRENYVERYTGTSRYDARNYDLVLNVDNIDTDEAVDIILRFIAASKD